MTFLQDGRTALMMAVKNGKEAIVGLVLEAGASQDIASNVSECYNNTLIAHFLHTSDTGR